MKNFRTLLILFSVLILPAGYTFAQTNGKTEQTGSKPNSHIKTKYNKSKDVTTVTLKTLQLSNSMNREVTRESEVGQLDLEAYFTYPGQQLSKPADAMNLTFKATQKNQLWMRAQSLVAIVDDQTTLLLGTTSYKSNSQTFYFEEFMAIAVPYDSIKKIADAKSLTLQLGSRTIRLKGEQLEDFRALVTMMTP